MKPSTKTPELEVTLINDAKWSLKKQNPENYTLIAFYRGLHCPKCKEQLEEITTHLSEFTSLGVNVIAISMDNKERAKKAGDTWKVPSLPIGYNLSEEKAREWGLYISKSISDKEPAIFSEPGFFLIEPNGTLYFASIQTMPFARPSTKDVLNAIKFIQKRTYPARGAS